MSWFYPQLGLSVLIDDGEVLEYPAAARLSCQTGDAEHRSK